ncbi:hypothetical protein PILCRDRAFT_219760 [Piloderma croceum F 1598]|uniref:N-acetyltransferase domain-containing protein n=1 Tax=Piloderma croceum (strain F 1598) TaxID=765440 RepID=A0A0C3GC29_PILCF|nr:hypothetical protein PILCRDRAFT_219760 [Piloderma croceum F 1598]
MDPSFRESDLRDILDLWNEPLVQQSLAIDNVVPRSLKFAEQIREWSSNPCGIYVIITLKDTDEFMGTCNIWMNGVKNCDSFLTVALLPKFWNKGYGTESTRFVVDRAFRWLGLHRVSLGVFESNKGAFASFKKIGFVVEGIKRKANWSDGKWEDIIDMSMLEEDWATLYWKKNLITLHFK